MNWTARPYTSLRLEAALRWAVAACLVAALLFALSCQTLAPASAGAKPAIKRPVVLVYSLPFPKDVKETPANLHLTLKAANVIDIGPNKANFPRGYYPDPKLLQIWREQGKVILRQGYFEQWAKAGAKPELVRDSDELITRWAASMREKGVDGIAIDEFQPHKKADYRVWVKTLVTTRKNFPDKYIFIWVSGLDLDREMCRAVRDYADFAVMEVYLKASEYNGRPQKILARMKQRLHNLMERAPGIEKKTLMGLGIGGRYDDDPKVDYPAFVTEQVRLISQDPELGKLQGLGIFAPHYIDRPSMRALDKAISKYLTPTK